MGQSSLDTISFSKVYAMTAGETRMRISRENMSAADYEAKDDYLEIQVAGMTGEGQDIWHYTIGE